MGRSTFEATATSQVQRDSNSFENIEQLMAWQAENSRIVFLHGDVTEHSISTIIAQMLYLANTNSNPIHLLVSTYGGSADEMFSLYDLIRFLPCPVHTVALGKVMSAGVLLLAAGVKGKRLMGASSRIMMHPVSSGGFGNIFEMENLALEHRRLHDLMVARLVKETKLTEREVKDTIMDPKLDYFVTPEQALQMGIIDRIIGNE